MANTLAEVIALFADNTSGDISEADMREAATYFAKFMQELGGQDLSFGDIADGENLQRSGNSIIGVAPGGGGGGLYASVAIIADEKAISAVGGANASGAFRTRELNTELADPDGIVSILSDQFTLQAGTYLIESRSSLNANANAAHARIRNITDGVTEIVGTLVSQADGGIDLVGIMTIAAAKVFELQVRSSGSSSDFSFFSDEVSIFNVVKITKLA